MLFRVAVVRTDVSDELIACVLRLLVTASVVPSSLILVTLKMEAIRSSETSVLTRAKWRHIPEDGIPKALFFCMMYTDGLIIVLLFVDSWEFVSMKGSCML
jgi:hypothetical protein